MTPFDRDAVRSFRFVRCEFDAGTGIARLVYAFDDGPELVETITVPNAPFELDAARAPPAEQALRLLHLVAGVSYYKAAVPGDIRIDTYERDDKRRVGKERGCTCRSKRSQELEKRQQSTRLTYKYNQ